MNKCPVVFHIPHASRHVPLELRNTLLLSDADLESELIRMTDSYTDELFDLTESVASRIVFPVSRLIVDPERFVDDAQEVMSAKGMGVVYTRTSDGRTLRRDLTPDERNALIRRYYDPHHERLARAVQDVLGESSECLVLDSHSFPSVPLPYEFDQSFLRPDICIGTDEYHTPDWLSELAVTLFRGKGLWVEQNWPFSGALVPLDHYRRTPQVRALMIEVNRSLYMDEITGTRSGRFSAFRNVLEAVLQQIIRV